jgi:hypothetical protein
MSKFEQAQEQHRETCRRGATVRARVRRMDAIEAYGSQCVVCGIRDPEQLLIVPTGGFRWRSRFPDPPPQGARNKLAWLAKHNYPSGFTLVCSPACRAHLARLTPAR